MRDGYEKEGIILAYPGEEYPRDRARRGVRLLPYSLMWIGIREEGSTCGNRVVSFKDSSPRLLPYCGSFKFSLYSYSYPSFFVTLLLVVLISLLDRLIETSFVQREPKIIAHQLKSRPHDEYEFSTYITQLSILKVDRDIFWFWSTNTMFTKHAVNRCLNPLTWEYRHVRTHDQT